MEQTDIVQSIQIEVSALRILCEELKIRTEKLENTVIIGYNGNLPLAEVVRNLTNTVSDYIARKEKEDEERKAKEEQFAKERRDQINRWIILLASIGIPILIGVISQTVYFYFKIVPMITMVSPIP